jgi:type II secretory pathway component GspD/PulD (secretin)
VRRSFVVRRPAGFGAAARKHGRFWRSAGNGARGNTGSSAGASGRTYPNNGTIGDAYFSIDPETRRVVYIADEATARYISQVLTNLDRPKPQVLIKVVFVQVTHNNASDIGIEGGWGRQDLGGLHQECQRRQRLRFIWPKFARWHEL